MTKDIYLMANSEKVHHECTKIQLKITLETDHFIDIISLIITDSYYTK